MVSQFTSPDSVRLLSDLHFDFPKNTHAIGRLDSTSEGLLILTTDKRITRLLYSGEKRHQRSYLVMVLNVVSSETLQHLRCGIFIPEAGGSPYLAIPDSVEIIHNPQDVYHLAKDPREAYPHTWLLITLKEGKFRQVRKMVMAVKHRCLRLIRISIGGLLIGDLQSGEVKEISKDELFTTVGLTDQEI